jgi:hypothetical protein
MTIQRIFCTDCRWVGVDSEVLRAPNPFTPVEELWGCPKCHGVNTMVRACEIEGCNEVGSIGDVPNYVPQARTVEGGRDVIEHRIESKSGLTALEIEGPDVDGDYAIEVTATNREGSVLYINRDKLKKLAFALMFEILGGEENEG